MNLQQIIIEGIKKAFTELYGITELAPVPFLEQTKIDFKGDYTLVVFPYLKQSKKSPEQTAQDIGQYLKRHVAVVAEFNVIKGFLNLEVANDFWVDFVQKTYANSDFGRGAPHAHPIMVEYSSPNTNKPLHLGHIRNNLLGYSVCEILKYHGYRVIKANLINDRGIHICKSMLAWMKYGNGETPQQSGLKGDHLVGKYYVEFDKAYKLEIEELVAKGMSKEQAEEQAPLNQEAKALLRKWEQGDSETIDVWKKMNSWVYQGFEVTYKRLGVNFDKFYYESDTYVLGKQFVMEGLKSGVFHQRDDGSVWVDLTSDGLDEKVLLRSDGTSVYMTQDLGTAQLKYDEFKMPRSVYVVGNEQDYHFKVLKLILKKLGKPYADGVFHLSYGMVDLPSGKMKSREGTVVDADDLMDEMLQTAKEITTELGKTEGLNEQQLHELYETVGMGALKYFLLRVAPKKRLMFNPAESIDFQGNTGPFVQYTYARLCSLLRSAAEPKAVPVTLDMHPEEQKLASSLYRFPEIISEAALVYSPAVVANYTYELVKSYNRFYHDLPVLKETDTDKRNFRIMLSLMTRRVVKDCLALLGIAAPERM